MKIRPKIGKIKFNLLNLKLGRLFALQWRDRYMAEKLKNHKSELVEQLEF